MKFGCIVEKVLFFQFRLHEKDTDLVLLCHVALLINEDSVISILGPVVQHLTIGICQVLLLSSCIRYGFSQTVYRRPGNCFAASTFQEKFFCLTYISGMCNMTCKVMSLPHLYRNFRKCVWVFVNMLCIFSAMETVEG